MKNFFTVLAVHSMYHLILALILFVVLFDTSGGFAIGTVIWTAISPPIIAIAGILGNLLWIFGLLIWICSIVVFVMALSDDAINRTTEESYTAGKLAEQGKMTLYGRFCFYYDSVLGILVVGSGFWFTGTGIILLMISIMVWRRVIVVARDAKLKQLKEKTASVDLLLEK